MKETTRTATANIIELVTFYVGDALCGMDILKIQEVNKLSMLTKVPQAPDYVLGVLNLRGQLVTVIDLSKKLGLCETNLSQELRNIIVNSMDGHVGLLVSRTSDVLEVDMNLRERTPANMNGIQGELFIGVYKIESHLIGLLDAEKVLNCDN